MTPNFLHSAKSHRHHQLQYLQYLQLFVKLFVFSSFLAFPMINFQCFLNFLYFLNNLHDTQSHSNQTLHYHNNFSIQSFLCLNQFFSFLLLFCSIFCRFFCLFLHVPSPFLTDVVYPLLDLQRYNFVSIHFQCLTFLHFLFFLLPLKTANFPPTTLFD